MNRIAKEQLEVMKACKEQRDRFLSFDYEAELAYVRREMKSFAQSLK